MRRTALIKSNNPHLAGGEHPGNFPTKQDQGPIAHFIIIYIYLFIYTYSTYIYIYIYIYNM